MSATVPIRIIYANGETRRANLTINDDNTNKVDFINEDEYSNKKQWRRSWYDRAAEHDAMGECDSQ